KTSVSGSAKLPGWESWKTLVSVTAYHSFGGEVEASNTPTIRRLTPSCRHQLSPIAPPQTRPLALRDRHHRVEFASAFVEIRTLAARPDPSTRMRPRNHAASTMVSLRLAVAR